MEEGRWVLLIASEVGGTDSVSDRAMQRLMDAISKEGYEVVRTGCRRCNRTRRTVRFSRAAVVPFTLGEAGEVRAEIVGLDAEIPETIRMSGSV